MNGICVFCGQEGSGPAFSEWVKVTFTDYDRLQDGSIVCEGCLFFLDEHSTQLQEIMGKDKPQKMRNYSHFIVAGKWIPLSKADKKRMQDLLLSPPFPELAAIAVSGQKHIVIRARRNPPNSRTGFVQFEEHSIYINPPELKQLLHLIEYLYRGFSKAEIETGNYNPNRIISFGFAAWSEAETQLNAWRGRPIFPLALFLAQRSENGQNRDSQSTGSSPRSDLEGDLPDLQEPLSNLNLDAVRGSDQERSIYQQPGEVHQLPLL